MKTPLKVGFIGWRGLVGSTLIKRMESENDFKKIEAHYFSTNKIKGPAYHDAYDLSELNKMDVLLTCRGSEYTQAVYEPLKASGWNGYWLDAASHLRLSNDALLVLDPINREQIDSAIQSGTKAFVGGNCTVSLLLLGIAGLLKHGQVEWMHSSSYQAISGAGSQAIADFKEKPAYAHNVLPWIDEEELKLGRETNKLLGLEESPISIDSTCVRVPVLRCHSQSVTLKLKERIPLTQIKQLIASSSDWVEIIENTQSETLQKLIPQAVKETLKIAVGRIRYLEVDEPIINLFTVGDQLLWGAVEPIRRMLNILVEGNTNAANNR